ncbi:uncharacterized protein TNCV_2503801 [Trichonephila clavipes]|nr:uncharacterized protein TNCV_2503801 [Trichonephila clavipes]
MTALNIIDDAYVIRGEQLKIQFLYTRPASSIKDESFNVITYKVFPTTRKETKSETFFIPSGMYHQAKDLFKEFKFIFLQLTADSRVRLHVPQNILVTFGERLKDLLGFVQRTFTHGDYKSEYPLELRAGITEVYVYCDIVSESLVGDSSASILKIIPVGNEHSDQIVKYFTVPLYFRVKKQFFDLIEIQIRTSSGTPLNSYQLKTIMAMRGRILQPEHCIEYYRNQIGNGDPYFSSDFPIQRGYGFFSNLRRYAFPLMIQAGKYLGKRLLTSGRNIVEEVSQGKSFRNAARDQLRQSGREITTDILRKLKGGGIRKVASISDSNTIEFLITGLGDAYFDLTHTYLNVQAKILKSDGSAFTPNDKCGPINYLLNTMFSECHISLNDRQISSESNYAYKAYIQSTLFHSESSQKNFLRAGLFYKDTVEEFDDTDLTATGKNLGLKKRFDHVKEGKIFDMCGILHTDLGTQPRLLISGTTIRVRLLKAKDEFTLLAKSGNYRLQIENISLFIRKCDVSSSILVGHEKVLEQSLVQMPFTRIETKTFTLSSGLKSVIIPNVVNGILPSRMILGLVSNSTFNGNFQKKILSISRITI